jgi:D-lactate dehydrogenase
MLQEDFMRTIVFSSQTYDRDSFLAADCPANLELHFQPARLSLDTAALADQHEVVCAFINDDLSAPVLERLAAGGTRLIALRSAGYNHVDLPAAKRLGLAVVRVPAYSPHAVAEHAVALILALNRRLHRAYNRTREGDFTLHGLTGFDLVGKTVGIVGTGQIGATFAKIMHGFGCELLAYDPYPNPDVVALGARYLSLPELLAQSRIISLHCPLNEQSGGLVDTPALIDALKDGQLGYLGLDVYEEEAQLFFEDRSDLPLQDDVLARLLTFPNVIITAHQAFLTREALGAIAATTLHNIATWAAGAPQNQVEG